jgi:hypothetical protein
VHLHTRVLISCLLGCLSGADLARAQAPRIPLADLYRAQTETPLVSISLEGKPGRGPRRALSGAELRTLATVGRRVRSGTPVLAVYLYGAPGASSLGRSQSMAQAIVRRLESMGCTRGSIVARGFGADRRLSAWNRMRGIATISRVDLFVVPASTTASAAPDADFRTEVTPYVRGVARQIAACTSADGIVRLSLTFDARGRVVRVGGGATPAENECLERALSRESIAAPPPAETTVEVALGIPRPRAPY